MFFAQKTETLIADKAALQLSLHRVKKTASVSKISAENIFTNWEDLTLYSLPCHQTAQERRNPVDISCATAIMLYNTQNGGTYSVRFAY